MRVDLLDSHQHFAELQRNWDALYLSDPEAQFFLSWPWLSHLYERRPRQRFVTLAVRPAGALENDGAYVAFLPLRLNVRRHKRHAGYYNEIAMAGNYWADCTGLLCRPEYVTEAIAALAEYLMRMRWARLKLDYVDMSERRLTLFTAPFRDAGWQVEEQYRWSEQDQVDGLVCPYVELPDSFENYLRDRLSANTRQRLRRFLRKVDTSSELHISYASAATIERDLELLGRFWADKWAQRKGDQVERLAATYQQILRQAQRDDYLFLPVLWQGDRPLAALGSFIDWQKSALLFFVAGRNLAYRDLPAGFILHGHSIRWAIANGLRRYELLAGNEPYKYRFGAVERRTRCVTISSATGANPGDLLDEFSLDDALARATRAHRDGDLERAEAGYRQVLVVRPHSLRARRRLARLLDQSGRPESI